MRKYTVYVDSTLDSLWIDDRNGLVENPLKEPHKNPQDKPTSPQTASNEAPSTTIAKHLPKSVVELLDSYLDNGYVQNIQFSTFAINSEDLLPMQVVQMKFYDTKLHKHTNIRLTIASDWYVDNNKE
jgi:hypothetical protein